MFNKARPVSINLMPQDPFYETPLGRGLLWASNIGRYLVIFTELVVIVSFVTRFKLDRDLTDLNTKIVQQSSLVDSYGSLEDQVRTVQKKTEFLKQQTSIYTPLEVLTAVAKLIPQGMSLTQTQVHDQIIMVSGVALSSKDIASFILAVQAQPHVKGLSVDNITSDEKGAAGFKFSMKIALAK